MHKWYGAYHVAVGSCGEGTGITYLIPSLKIEVAVSSKYLVLSRPTLKHFLSSDVADTSDRQRLSRPTIAHLAV
jgi:hypothetical protein